VDKSPTNYDSELRLKILRSKRDICENLKRQGILTQGTQAIMDESYVRTWEGYTSKGTEGLGLEDVRNSKDQVSSFLVALLKNYFLELSVDKVELMCDNYVKTFNRNSNFVKNIHPLEDNIADIAIVPSGSISPSPNVEVPKPEAQIKRKNRKDRKSRQVITIESPK
jgi:hypothetical protein